MSAAYAIARRELLSFFFSPIAYVVMTLFLLVCGYLFRSDFTPGAPVGMRAIFEWMVWLLVFISPVLTMGLLSSEWDKGTIETLMTAPVGETSVVLGKFAGSFAFFVVLLVPTLLYVVLLSFFGTPEIGPLASGYFGILLVGSLFTSIGLFCSALTRSQIIAAVSAAGILFLITIVPAYAAGNTELGDWARIFIRQMVFQRYSDFSRGVIDLGHVAFFLAATAVFLFLTIKVLESRRWK
jgi:ABC-2 type transport system permease protein